MKLTITVLAFAVYAVGVSAVYAGGCSSNHDTTTKDVTTEKKSASS